MYEEALQAKQTVLRLACVDVNKGVYDFHLSMIYRSRQSRFQIWRVMVFSSRRLNRE